MLPLAETPTSTRPTLLYVLDWMTSPQTMQAFLVGVFSVATLVLVLRDVTPPTEQWALLFAVVGYYFSEVKLSNGKLAANVTQEVQALLAAREQKSPDDKDAVG